MSEEILYRKVGKRYVRVNDPWAYTGLSNGHWHVWVRPHSTTMRQFIIPDKEGVSAAIEEVRDAMVAALIEANRGTPSTVPLSEKEKEAYKVFCDIMEDEDAFIQVNRLSIQDLIDKGLKPLSEYFRKGKEEESNGS
jgi:hypothetical protein